MSTYFGDHMPKRQYVELAEMYEIGDEWGSKILTQALMRRAMMDVQRIMQIREEKPSLQNLVRSGVVGEAMLENINAAESELELECQDLIAEADLFRDGWGKTILQEAGSFIQLQNQQNQQKAQAQAAAEPQSHAGHSHDHSDPNHSHSHDSTAEANPNITEIEETADDVPELLTKEELAERAAKELLAEEEVNKKKNGGKASKGGKKKK
ncbi:translocation protein S66 [Chytriomyces hyalinus]|nr:translocation protein S66 [Chytriomyces hyalinus]KAJ3251972.1 translocation protein S66 [Chytriomyces hyalinus]